MKRFLTILFLLMAVATAEAQITGVVIDGENGKAFSGVEVLKKGTYTGAISGAEGQYSINAKAGDVLQFSFIGYKSVEVTVVATSDVYDVELFTDETILEEVVVVGYGVQKKSDITGSVASIGSEVLQERPYANVVQSLQGAVAGLNISMTGSNAEGSSSSTVIRGGNSISASNKPLIILDGIPFTGSWSEVNSSDVESIEILKDASSAAIYGARGANGVILIQTKRGGSDRIAISYDGSITSSSAINIPEMMDGETFYQAKLEGGGDFTFTELAMYEAGESTDWLDLAMRTGFKQQHNLSIRGASGATSYYLSANIVDAAGISLNDDFTRTSYRLNLEQKIKPWLSIGTNTSYGVYDRSGIEADFSDAFLANPLSEAYNEDGSMRLQTWEDNNYSKNPLSSLNEVNSDITTRFSTNNYVNIDLPIDGLSYKLNTGYDYSSALYQNYQGTDTYEGNEVSGILEISNTYTRDWIIENIVSYNKTFDKHTIFLTALYSAQSTSYENNSISAQGFPSDVMTYYQPDKASSLQASASEATENHLSQMFRANYSYDSRYLFTATVRRDGYSAFGADKKYGVFPSLALGWNITNESFVQSSSISDIFNNLKLRLSWGKNGNEAISAYSTLPSLSSLNYLSDSYTASYGFYPSQLSSPTLGWETTSSYNVGLDFAMLANRITGSIEYYRTQTKDLLLYRTIPSINGTSSVLENIGQTSGNGIEFQISSVIINKKDFTWSADFNIAHNKTVLVDVGLYDENGNPIDDTASGWYIGESVSVNYDYVFDGIYQESDIVDGVTLPLNAQAGYVKYKDLDNNGEIEAQKDQTIIGDRSPLFVAGLNNTFSYKNVFLSIFINGSYGITMPNYLLNDHSLSYRKNQLDKEFWSADNPINTYPANVGDGSVNTLDMYFYERADYLRIKDINLGYRFSKEKIQKIGLNKLEMYCNIKNLYTFTPWSGLDPEFLTSQLSIPQTREFVFGVRLEF